MFVERMFDFLGQKFGGKNRTYVRRATKKVECPGARRARAA
jgi:hypothetical protein